MTISPDVLPPHVRIGLFIPPDPGRCWIWQGAVGVHGYPISGSATPLQYVVYRAVHGALRAFDRPVNSCGHRLCLNPNHIAAKVRVIGKRDYARK